MRYGVSALAERVPISIFLRSESKYEDKFCLQSLDSFDFKGLKIKDVELMVDTATACAGGKSSIPVTLSSSTEPLSGFDSSE